VKWVFHRAHIGAGSVAGLAVGFGAQSLIKDYFNGFSSCLKISLARETK